MKHSAITRILILLMLLAIGYFFELSYKYIALIVSDKSMHPFSYLVSGVIDSFVVCALSLFGKSSLIKDIQKINAAAVFTHCYGFLIYMFGFEKDSYVIILAILTIMQWCRLIWVTNGDNNSIDNNFRVDSFLDSHHNLHKSNHAGSHK